MKIEGLATISEKHLPVLREYFDIVRERWETPYSWLSPINYLNSAKIGFVEDCLIVLTHSCQGYYTMKLKYPPVSKSGNKTIEKQVSRFLLSEGMSILSFAENVEAVEKKWKVTSINSKDVFVKRFAYENLKGRKHRKVRQKINKYRKMVRDGEIKVEIRNNYFGLEDCYENWSVRRLGKVGKTLANAKNCLNHFDFKILVILDKNNKEIASRTLIPYSEDQVISSLLFGDLPHLNLWLNYQTFVSFPKLQTINVGASRTKNVFNAKTETDHEIGFYYRIPGYDYMTKEKWYFYKSEIQKNDFKLSFCLE